MIDQNGELLWEEDKIYDGIRQDATESIRRYRIIRNAHFRNMGALTKDLGIRQIHSSAISAYDVKAAMDLHWTEGTQDLAVIQASSGTSTLHLWNSSTNEFGSSKGVAIAAVDQPDMLLFANKLIILDGTTLRSMASNGTMATPGESSYSNPSKFGAVYANRLIVSGNATYPFSFFPSGIRDSGTWDVDLSVDVTGLHGDAISCLGICGQFLIVGGRRFLRAYYLGTTSPKDWDWDEISNEIGPINHQSFQTVTRNGRSYAFFMSEEGPMMLSQQGGSGVPSLFPLWKPLDKAVRGIDHQGLTGLKVSNFDEVNTVYVPEYDEIRFCCNIDFTGSDGTPNGFIAVDLNSAIAYTQDANNYPFWRVRDNTISELNVSRLFICRVDATTGRPSITGQNRCMCARDGRVFEMDARNQFVDDPGNTPIPFLIRKDGYDGREDGIREHTKSIQRIHVRTNQSGDYRLYGRLITNGGQQTTNMSVDGLDGIPLDTGLSYWGADPDEGSWSDGGIWNEGEFIVQRAGVHGVGKKFDLELFDNGNIQDEFQINSWSLSGMVEDRR